MKQSLTTRKRREALATEATHDVAVAVLYRRNVDWLRRTHGLLFDDAA